MADDEQTELLSELKAQGFVKSKPVENAFLKVDRKEFLWEGTPKGFASVDEPLLLGDTGQTISAPSMVAIMLEELELLPSLRVLEVGGGSGYNAALIGMIVKSPEASELVTSVEQDPRLVEFARERIKRLGLERTVKVVRGDGTLGFPPRSEEETYDRIIVTAAAHSVPHYLERQLKTGGVLEIPIGNLALQRLTKFRKVQKDEGYALERKEIVSCVFVPLVGEGGYNL